MAQARHISSPATRSTPPSAPPAPENLTTASTWFWRTVYLSTGLAATGVTVSYMQNPEPIQSTMKSIRENIDSRIRFFSEPSREQLLPDQPIPYPGAPPVRTLVIDLEKTLVHSSYSRSNGWRVAKRPGAEAFLAYMASFYEIVVFTSSPNTYAEPILDKLDPTPYISHRLYRAETHYKNGVHMKDLAPLNRDLSRVVMIDHCEAAVSPQPENSIIVPEWSGDASDTALLDLIPFLEDLVRLDVSDVREELAVLRGKSVEEGVAEFRARTAARVESGRPTSLFGNAAEAPRFQQTEEEEGSKGVVWGSLSRNGLFFSRSGEGGKEEAKEAKEAE